MEVRAGTEDFSRAAALSTSTDSSAAAARHDQVIPASATVVSSSSSSCSSSVAASTSHLQAQTQARHRATGFFSPMASSKLPAALVDEMDRLSNTLPLVDGTVLLQRRQRIASASGAGATASVFFRRQTTNFGSVLVGSVSRQRVDICNAGVEDVTVYLSDPELPFVLLQNELRLRARSFIRVPVRFVPVSVREYSAELEVVAQTSTGEIHCSILMIGSSHTNY